MATLLSYEDFLDYVKKWIVENEKKISSMWPQKGGWEGWAQAEIYSYVLRENSTFEILREQHIYTSDRKAADFVLNHSWPIKNRVIVELKCQSFENHATFKAGLENDSSKLIRELKSSYAGAALLVIGIYFRDRMGVPEYFYKKVPGYGEVGMCWAIDLNS